MLLGLALFREAARLGQAGRLVGFVIALVYFGLLNSRIGGGQTLGKRLVGIRVIDRAGNALSPTRSVVRFLVIGVPYFLDGLWFDMSPATSGVTVFLLGALLIFAVFGGLGAAAYLYVFNRRTRQSLHDLAVGSFVVRDPPPVTTPIGFSTPRLHLIVVGCWLAFALIAPGVTIGVVHQAGLDEPLQPLVGLQAAIKLRLDLRQVQVSIGSSASTDGPTTSFLQVDAQPGGPQEDLEALLPLIAGVVLELHPDLLGKQLLIVHVARRFDFGIAGWSVSHEERLDAAAWHKKLEQTGSQPSKT